jgi:hypothetical protein
MVLCGCKWENIFVTSQEMSEEDRITPSFEPSPLRIFNQEERTTNSEMIGIRERVEGDTIEYTIEEEGEVNATSPRRVWILRTLTPNSQIGVVSLSMWMVNQDSTLRLPMFHGMGKDDVEQHWFTCEAI